MAITACAARFVTSAICYSVNGERAAQTRKVNSPLPRHPDAEGLFLQPVQTAATNDGWRSIKPVSSRGVGNMKLLYLFSASISPIRTGASHTGLRTYGIR